MMTTAAAVVVIICHYSYCGVGIYTYDFEHVYLNSSLSALNIARAHR